MHMNCMKTSSMGIYSYKNKNTICLPLKKYTLNFLYMRKLVMFFLAFICAEVLGDIGVNMNYEGANAIINKIDGNSVWIKPDLRDTSTRWFYWSIELTKTAGKKVSVYFENDDFLGNQGPAYSFDGGRTWNWLGAKSFVRRNKDNPSTYFTQEIPKDVDSVRYCFSIPYTLDDFKKFAAKFENNPNFKINKLATTLRGNENFNLSIGNKNAPIKLVMLARQHCCEASASYLLEGILAEVMSDSPEAKFLMENTEMFVVPFADLDGVRAGDQGKNRRPHDHNRDYLENPVYPSVKAIMERYSSFPSGSKIIGIDFHCPGRLESESYFYYSSKEFVAENTKKLSQILERQAKDATDAMPFTSKYDVIFGERRNNKIDSSFRHYTALMDNTYIGTTFEFAYADSYGVVFTPERGRNFGKLFAHAICEYVRGIKDK